METKRILILVIGSMHFNGYIVIYLKCFNFHLCNYFGTRPSNSAKQNFRAWIKYNVESVSDEFAKYALN